MRNDEADTQSEKTVRGKSLTTVAAIALCGLLAGLASHAGIVETLYILWTGEGLSSVIENVGPLAVVVLLAVAVVVSPIPSGPIAMAAGAMLGPFVGGALTALGALLGALIAFSLSRGLGYRPLSASNLPLADWITRPRQESKLAFIVLVSRLIPFISFDAVSYVAGLTTIRVRNFALATAVGVLPASFAFAALGAGMARMDNVMLMIAACGVTAILPVIWGLSRTTRARQT